MVDCESRGYCLRDRDNIPSGQQIEHCYGIHAEQNAIMFPLFVGKGLDLVGATLYVTHSPCANCAKLILETGISKVYYKHAYTDNLGLKILQEGGVKTYHVVPKQ